MVKVAIKKNYFKLSVMYTLFLTGELGQVYKGYLKTHYTTDVVAVKTLKGEYHALVLIISRLHVFTDMPLQNVWTIIKHVIFTNVDKTLDNTILC